MGDSRRVLVVDDNRDAADMLAACVELAGGVASSVYSAKDAIERAQTLQPDVVLLDLELPDGDGASVARAVRRVCRARVVAVTGHDEHVVLGTVPAGTFDACVTKPCTLDVLGSLLAP